MVVSFIKETGVPSENKLTLVVVGTDVDVNLTTMLLWSWWLQNDDFR